MKQSLNLIILLILCCSCSETSSPILQKWQEIDGRDSAEERLIIRRPVYRVKVPDHWKRVTPLPETSLVDTTLPLVEFWIDDQVHITLHNFPLQQIPPRAQVSRWQRQLTDLPPKEAIIFPVSHGGYAGLYFEGCTKEKQVMAWALQLDQEHIRNLSRMEDSSNRTYLQQMKADVTIKVVGPPRLCEHYRHEVELFANSFELIQEIPRAP